MSRIMAPSVPPCEGGIRGLRAFRGPRSRPAPPPPFARGGVDVQSRALILDNTETLDQGAVLRAAASQGLRG